MSIEIRIGTKADIPFALNLVKELAVYEKAPNEVEVTIEEMTEWGFGTDKQFDFYVALENDVIVGLALYYYKYSTWKGKCLFLEDIIVTESQRGKGLGKLLFDKVVQVSKEQKVRRMEWQVLDWNTPAIEFYKKYDATLDDEWVNCKLTNHQLEKM
ncbi:MAG: GNAT family N-acetyltransferase [Bacteroidetes bacterium]|nr:GNAT family N-acetyltransferase [Bacteroidota bacterium]